jgi:hypothetical protein
LLICNRLFDKAYYNQVIFRSPSDRLDKTVQSIEEEVKIKIEFVSDGKILCDLQQLLKKKIKLYPLVHYVKFKKIIPEMERLIKEKHLY